MSNSVKMSAEQLRELADGKTPLEDDELEKISGGKDKDKKTMYDHVCINGHQWKDHKAQSKCPVSGCNEWSKRN